MIHSVKLLRWKSHEKTEIAFSKGTNVLVGPMGAGKTSVVDALSFALYGTFPSLKSKKLTLEEIVMQRPQKYSEGKVEVLLETNGKKYTIERTISQGGTKAFLMEGGKLIETGPARVNEAVVRLLKTDYELFARTIYADQNNIDAFLSLASGERKRQIDELLGLDKFEKARAGAGSGVNKLKAMKGEAERAMAGVDEAKLKQELEKAHGEEKEISAKLEEAAKQSKELEGQVAFKKDKLLKLVEKQAEYALISGELSGQKAALESLQANIERISSSLAKKFSQTELEGEAKRISLELARQLELRKTVMELLPKKEKLSAEIEASQKRLAVLARETEGKNAGELQAMLSQLLAKLAQSKEKERQLSEKHAEMAASLALCKKAGEEKNRLEKLVNEMSALAGEKSALLEKSVKIEEDAVKVEQDEQLERAHSAKVIELQEAIAKLGASTSLCVVCDSPLTVEKSAGLLSKKNAELQVAQVELARIGTERKALSAEVEKARQLKNEFEKLSEKLLEQRDALQKASQEAAAGEGHAGEIVKHSVEIASARQAMLELVKKESEIASATNALNERDELSKRLEQIQEREKTVFQALSQAQQKYSEQKRTELEEQKGEVEKNRELLLLQAQAEKTKELLSQAEQKISKLQFDPKELDASRSEFSETEKKLATVKVVRESNEKLLAEKKVRAAEITQKVENAARQAARLKKLDSSVSTLSKFQNAVSQAQGYLRSELVQAVNEAAGMLWKSIYPYADYQSVKLNAGEVDYSVELLANTGEWFPCEHASGGEKTCASLSLRIAFATVLTPYLSLLVLDEPTHNLDANAITTFCRTLREELPKIVEQTFIITHDEALKEGANAAVYKIERDKDRGDKSTVEKLSAN